MARCDLRAQIAFALLGSAYVVQQQGEHVAIHYACTHDLHGRDTESLLIDFAAESHRSCICAAHVSMMRPRCYVEVGMVYGFARAKVPARHKHWSYPSDIR